MIRSKICCIREEGLLAFWKGNGANVIRIFPYSAAQLAANDTYKRLLEPKDGRYEGVTTVRGNQCLQQQSVCQKYEA
jgi:Mitochondrial carrier protein